MASRVTLPKDRIKGLARSYHTTQKMIRKLIKQFAFSAKFDVALNRFIEERL